MGPPVCIHCGKISSPRAENARNVLGHFQGPRRGGRGRAGASPASPRRRPRARTTSAPVRPPNPVPFAGRDVFAEMREKVHPFSKTLYASRCVCAHARVNVFSPGSLARARPPPSLGPRAMAPQLAHHVPKGPRGWVRRCRRERAHPEPEAEHRGDSRLPATLSATTTYGGCWVPGPATWGFPGAGGRPPSPSRGPSSAAHRAQGHMGRRQGKEGPLCDWEPGLRGDSRNINILPPLI